MALAMAAVLLCAIWHGLAMVSRIMLQVSIGEVFLFVRNLVVDANLVVVVLS